MAETVTTEAKETSFLDDVWSKVSSSLISGLGEAAGNIASQLPNFLGIKSNDSTSASPGAQATQPATSSGITTGWGASFDSWLSGVVKGITTSSAATPYIQAGTQAATENAIGSFFMKYGLIILGGVVVIFLLFRGK